MRGQFQDQGGFFSYIRPEERIPADHPLREIRKLVREVLQELSHSFGELYSQEGRPSIPPEQLLSALLLQVFYGLRSERQLMEQLNYNLLFRWFVGLSPDDPVWDATTFTKNRDRLQRGDVFRKFMERLLNHPKVKPLLSDEHFSVDGTLIEAWASHKSFQPKDGSDDVDGSNFHGQRRKHDPPHRLPHLTVVPRDERVHLRLGQAARHHAQDQAPRYCRRGCRFPAQSHRLQSRAHPQAHRRLRLEPVRKPQIAPKARRKIQQNNKNSFNLQCFSADC